MPPSLSRAGDRLRQALGVEDAGQSTVRVPSRGDALAGYRDDSTRGSSVAVRSNTFGNDHFAARAGARVDSLSGLSEHAKLRFDDSALVTEAFGVELQAFSHRNWWGSGWQSSLTLSNNAPALNCIDLRRASGPRSEFPLAVLAGPQELRHVHRADGGRFGPCEPLLLRPAADVRTIHEPGESSRSGRIGHRFWSDRPSL